MLKELRGSRTAQSVRTMAANRFGVKFSTSVLYQYEGGTVRGVDAGVLWAIAQIYGVDIFNLIKLLVLNRNQPDLDTLPAVAPGPLLVDDAQAQLLKTLNRLTDDNRDRVWQFIDFTLHAQEAR
jgi:transcriptional regulator with XRE-family HTH domain